jgi:hypothetical protein
MISRYLDRLAALVRPRRAALAAVSSDAKCLRIGDQRIAWRDVHRVDAFKGDVHVVDLLCLAILNADGRVFEMDEEMPGWKEAADAIEQHLPGSLSHAEWSLRLMAAEPGKSVSIYSAIKTG